MINNAKILITGGFGFIGAHLAKELSRRDFRLILLDNAVYSGSSADALELRERKNIELKQCTAQKIHELDDFSCDYIVHAAGILGIRKVVEQPILTMDVNILGTQSALEFACRNRSLKRFIQFSTSEVYGQHADSKDEDSDLVIPVSSDRWCYAASKVAAEFMVKAYAKEKQLPTVIVRPFNVYGPHRFGSNALGTLTKQALRGEQISLSGDGSQRRSWCHVDDFVRGLVACLETDGVSGQTFNLGNDKNNLSMLELAELICRVTKSSSKIVADGPKDPDVEFRRPNINKARKMLGYEPQVELPAGIADVASALYAGFGAARS